MKKIVVYVEVDEDAVLNSSGQTSLEDAIVTELGWLHNSGMTVEGWKFQE